MLFHHFGISLKKKDTSDRGTLPYTDKRIIEMISLGLVVPFLTVLIDPKLLFDNSFTASIVNFLLDQINNLRLILLFLSLYLPSLQTQLDY